MTPGRPGTLPQTSTLPRLHLVARIARAEAGAVWADVVGPAAGYGLAGLAGTERQATHLKGTT